MDDLVKLIMDRIDDLDEDGARRVVEVVMEFLTERLPEPFGDQIENLLDGNMDVQDLLGKLGGSGGLGGLGGMLGGLLGGNDDK